MNHVNQKFFNSVREWVNTDLPSRVGDKVAIDALSAKALLYGVQLPEDSRERVKKCLVKDSSIEVLGKRASQSLSSEPTDIVQLDEDMVFAWLVKTTMNCASDVLKELSSKPYKESFIPLSPNNIQKLPGEAVVYVFKEDCDPCHRNLVKKMCAMRTIAPHLYSLPITQEALLPESVQSQIEWTPFFLHYKNGQYQPISMATISKVIESHCSSNIAD